jgi:hypothetical protein
MQHKVDTHLCSFKTAGNTIAIVYPTSKGLTTLGYCRILNIFVSWTAVHQAHQMVHPNGL